MVYQTKKYDSRVTIWQRRDKIGECKIIFRDKKAVQRCHDEKKE